MSTLVECSVTVKGKIEITAAQANLLSMLISPKATGAWIADSKTGWNADQCNPLLNPLRSVLANITAQHDAAVAAIKKVIEDAQKPDFEELPTPQEKGG